MSEQVPGKQLLHLVLGGELTELGGTEFKRSRQARHRRRLPELRHRLCRLEGEGAADRRQRAYALFHRPPAPPARSRQRGAGRRAEVAGADAAAQASRRTRPPSRTPSAPRRAWYLRLVWRTSRGDHRAGRRSTNACEMPAIIAMWHGQHFMAPFIKRRDRDHRAKVLISRHRDGEINARAAERLGIGTIRGSGAHNGEFHRKGGAVAFTEMLDALEGRLQRRAHRRRAEGGARRRPRRGQAGAAFRPADLSGGDRHQPAHRTRQLGPQRHQSAVRPHRHGGGRGRSWCRATPTTPRWKRRGSRSSTSSTA